MQRRELEEKLDEKTALLIKVQRVYMESAGRGGGEVAWALGDPREAPASGAASEPLEVSAEVDAEEPRGDGLATEEEGREEEEAAAGVPRGAEAGAGLDVDRRFYVESFLESELRAAYAHRPAAAPLGGGGDVGEGQRLATISVLRRLLGAVKGGAAESDALRDGAGVAGVMVAPGVVEGLERRLLSWQVRHTFTVSAAVNDYICMVR